MDLTITKYDTEGRQLKKTKVTKEVKRRFQMHILYTLAKVLQLCQIEDQLFLSFLTAWVAGVGEGETTGSISLVTGNQWLRRHLLAWASAPHSETVLQDSLEEKHVLHLQTQVCY